MNWNNLQSLEQLEEIDQLSESQPVIIFKHSTRCSISAASLDRLERKWDDEEMQNCLPFFLDLIRHREVSNAIAKKYSMPHQSPQVLVIRQGKCTFEASHFGINYQEVESEANQQPA